MVSREPWLTLYDLVASQQEGVGTEGTGTSGWGLGTGDAGGFGMGLCSATQVPHMPSTCRRLKTGEHLHPRASSTHRDCLRPSWLPQRCRSAHAERAQTQGGVKRQRW